MINLNVNFLERIIKGNAILFVGAGASANMGYPSWEKLTKEVYNKAIRKGLIKESGTILQKISKEEYIDVFTILERQLSRTVLINILKEVNIPNEEIGKIYSIISHWPFACFFTTNYDNEIKKHLDCAGRREFEVCQNTKSDFDNFSSDMDGFIFKIHGDFEHPDCAVITEDDYDKYYTKDANIYYLKGLESIFRLFPIIILGYSLKDPDISYILKKAKEYSSPKNRIYMLLADISDSDVQRYLEKFNIQVFSYNNADGKHSELLQMLNIYNSFFFKGNHQYVRQGENAEKATSLYIFRTLNQRNCTSDFANLLLLTLPSNSESGISECSLKEKLPITVIACFKDLVNHLLQNGLILKTDDCFKRTPKGDEFVGKAHNNLINTKDIAINNIIKKIREKHQDIDEAFLRNLIDETISRIFEIRGLSIAKRIFSESCLSSGELIDIFDFLIKESFDIHNNLIRLTFINEMRSFFVNPDTHQKRYLAAVSQGYFLYHLMGMEKNNIEFRNDVFANTLWFVDSNIIIPLLAEGCFDHEFIKELFFKLKKYGAKVFVTDNVLQEVMDHLVWAEQNIVTNHDLLTNATLIAGNRQNLFVDGFVNSGKCFENFRSYCNNIRELTNDNFSKFLETYNIQCENLEIESSDEQQQFEDKIAEITEQRIKSKSYTKPLQTKTEAELFFLMKRYAESSSKYIYFLSQSHIFDLPGLPFKRWTPEQTFRYLLSLPGEKVTPTTLHECLLNNFFLSGLNFINEKNYCAFFKQDIDSAKLQYQEEKEKYIELLESLGSSSELDVAFESTPDLEKPLFLEQMLTKIADLSTKKLKQIQGENEEKNRVLVEKNRAIAEKDAKIKRLEKQLEKQKDDELRAERREQVEAARKRNLRDPKHVAKRQRQKKARDRKK